MERDQSDNLVIYNRVRAGGLISFLRTLSCDGYINSGEQNVNYNVVDEWKELEWEEMTFLWDMSINPGALKWYFSVQITKKIS